MKFWLINAQQLDSVAQLVRALHRNRRAADSIHECGGRGMLPGESLKASQLTQIYRKDLEN